VAGFLRRRFWVVNLVVIGSVAALAAHAVRQVLEPVDEPAALRPTIGAPPPDVGGTKAGRGILAHNIFCSTCPPPGPDEGVVREAQSRLPVMLVGTLVTPEALRSVAVIRDRGPAPARQPEGASARYPVAAYRPGDRVAGYQAVVERIDARRVWLRVNGRLEYVDLLAPAPPGRGAPRPTRAPRRAI
jgi:hypothetical protein